MTPDQQARLEAALAPFVDDVRRTLDADFDVSVILSDDDWMWSVYRTEAGPIPLLDEPASMVAWFAAAIPDSAFDDVLDPWPRCPLHLDHPLYAEVRDRQAVWVCRQASQAVCEIGQLAEVPTP